VDKRKTQDFGQALRHLSLLEPNPDAIHTFQTFPEGASKGTSSAGENARLVPRIFHGTLDQHWKELCSINDAGGGVFVVPNETDGRGRKRENFVRVRAVFADKDNGPIGTTDLEPSFRVVSKRGEHAYWLTSEAMTAASFTALQKAIARRIDSDPKVSDPTRVMRIAGLFHQKDPNDPFLVTIVEGTLRAYSNSELSAAFSAPSEKESTERVAQRPFQQWVESLSCEEGSKNPLGGRNCTLLLIAREGLACGVEAVELRAALHAYCCRSGEPTNVADEILKRQQKEHEATPFKRFYVYPEEKLTIPEIAEQFLVARGYRSEEGLRLRFFNGDLLRYEDRKYVKAARKEIQAEVVRFLQCNDTTEKLSTIATANNIVANIEAFGLIRSNEKPPRFLSSESVGRLVPLSNGILNVDKFFGGSEEFLLSHTPDFFSLSCLPFPYEAGATCPAWQSFIEQMLPDREVRAFLQEWFGYNLVVDSSHQKFVLLVGDGANGKTVVCVVLRALLGNENVSAVGLEQFDAKRTFPLAAMHGKLANIVEEIGDIDRAAEGILKDIVSGGVLTIERKHQDPFEAIATARLTFATNALPRFRDRTLGLWRRMIPIPFEVQIVDPAQQNRKFVDPDWWRKSGELPGILNWSLEGIRRLTERGSFAIPKVCQEFVENYRKESNPARQFLEECCHEKEGSVVSSKNLYSTYLQHMRDIGGRPLGHPAFTKEVLRTFSRVTLSKHPQRVGPDRTRVFEGLGLFEGGQSRDY